VNGAAGQKTNNKKLNIGPCEKTQFQGKSVPEINRQFTKTRFCYHHYTLTWADEKLRSSYEQTW
jgi:hypothetical protein